MKKPTTVVLKDGKISLREVCVMFKAEYIWMDGVKYKLPKEWNEQ